MTKENYLYLIKTIEDDKVQLVTSVESSDGVVLSEGKVCAVLKRYTPPVDMTEALQDVQKYTAGKSAVIQHHKTQKTGRVYTDHVGNTFDTVYQLCAYYGVSESKYHSRLNNGWTLEEALTGIRQKRKVVDHLGNVFNSKSDMCQHYGIPLARYEARIKSGQTKEEALLGVTDSSTWTVEDHLGNKYLNTSQMCKHYGVRMDMFCQRKKRGWTLEEALTGKKKNTPVTDHNGKQFPNMEEMCAAYEVPVARYSSRIKLGWTVEEALTGLRKENIAQDHLGNIYVSAKDMCESYGLNYGTFKNRIKQGWSLERALTEDTSRNPHKLQAPVKDHLGNEYDTIAAMCEAYRVSRNTYQARIRNGYSVEAALLGKKVSDKPEPIKTLKKPKVKEDTHPKPPKVKTRTENPVSDHKGNTYASTKEMCDAYGLRVDTFKSRIKSGKSLEEALTRTPSMVTTNKPCQDHLGNQYNSQIEMARAYGLTKDLFIARRRMGWSLEEILTTPLNGVRKSREFIHNGVVYESKRAFCEHHGIKYELFIHRLRSGMTVEQAISPTPLSKQKPAVEVTDHKGITFESVQAMCDAYGIRVATYKYRLAHGWDLESTLTTPLNSKRIVQKEKEKKMRCYDHKGNGYRSKREMCEAYGISIYTFKKRQESGMNLADSLETPVETEKAFAFKDHEGRTFDGLREMCSAWGVSVHTYQKRVSLGYSIERALSEPDDSAAVRDHKGNSYPTIQSMCEAYGITASLYNSRIRRGKSLQEALETPLEDQSVEYEGITYSSLKELAEKKNINAGTLRSRIKMGWSLDEAVTGIKRSRIYIDHTGKEYPSQKEMCSAHGIEPSVYQGRIRQGWTVEQALTNTPPQKLQKPRRRTDHKGNEYPDLAAMCQAYGISVSTYQKRISMGMNIEEALTSTEPVFDVIDHNGNKYDTVKAMCEAYGISTASYYAGIKRGKPLADILNHKSVSE